jgi:multimeric flavodoxin WrbA
MYILTLYGSPRQNGNTDILLDEFIKGATSVKSVLQIEKIYVRNLKITPCQEYGICLKTGECAIKDEMSSLYDKLLRADLVVLSAPVFFSNVPAQVKIIIDRSQPLWARKYILKTISKDTKRKGFFISVAGTEGKDVFSGILSTVKYFFKAINVDYAGELLYNKIDDKGVIREHLSALKETFQAGQKLASEMTR